MEGAMPTKLHDQKINTTKPNAKGAAPEQRQPHERDESPEGAAQPRGVMKQAADDLAQGLVDTDLHNTPGIDHGVQPRGPASPRSDAADGMRHQSTTPGRK
jgi:hypothetical protein